MAIDFPIEAGGQVVGESGTADFSPLQLFEVLYLQMCEEEFQLCLGGVEFLKTGFLVGRREKGDEAGRRRVKLRVFVVSETVLSLESPPRQVK